MPTCLTAVHISQPCIAVLVDGGHALYVRAAEGQSGRREFKPTRSGPSISPSALCGVMCRAIILPFRLLTSVICLCFSAMLIKAANQEIHRGFGGGDNPTSQTNSQAHTQNRAAVFKNIQLTDTECTAVLRQPVTRLYFASSVASLNLPLCSIHLLHNEEVMS